MPKSDPHFIPEPDRAEGEPGVGGLSRKEAEEREAAESAPEILEGYRARMREAEQAANPPPGQPWPTQAAADMMKRGEWPPIPARAPLRAHFDQALRRGRWICFGFSEELGERSPIRSPWREVLKYDDKGAMTNDNRPTHSEVLFYLAGAENAAPLEARSAKGRPGRKKINDPVEVAAARELVSQGKTDHAAAHEVAWGRYPDPKHDDPRRKLARRIRDRLRDDRRN